MPKNATVATWIELCLLSVVGSKLSVLVAEHETGGYALPSGAVRTDLDVDMDAAGHRIASEIFGLTLPKLKMVTATGGRNRDASQPWSVSFAYRANIHEENFAKKGTKWLSVADLKKLELPFGDNQLIVQAVSALRGDVESLHLPFEMLPDVFPYRDLHHICEVILNRKLEQSRLRQRLAVAKLLVAENDITHAGKGRPAALYSARKKGAAAPVAKKAATVQAQATKPKTATDIVLAEESTKKSVTRAPVRSIKAVKPVKTAAKTARRVRETQGA